MDKFYLRDTRTDLGSNAMFWANGGGYTSNVLNAEVFDRDSALRQHESRNSDLPVPVEIITPHLRTRFDMQHLPSQATNDGLCVLVNMDRFDGNDCYFMCADGTFTFEFDQALRTPYDTAKAITATFDNLRLRIYRADDLLNRLRKSVASKHCGAAEMAKAGNYQLKRPEKVKMRRETFNCVQCGKFISESEFYQGCKKCGASNY